MRLSASLKDGIAVGVSCILATFFLIVGFSYLSLSAGLKAAGIGAMCFVVAGWLASKKEENNG